MIKAKSVCRHCLQGEVEAMETQDGLIPSTGDQKYLHLTEARELFILRTTIFQIIETQETLCSGVKDNVT